MHPLQGHQLVEGSQILCVGIVLAVGQVRQMHETVGSKSVGDGDEDDIGILFHEVGAVVLRVGRSANLEAATVDPHHDRLLPGRRIVGLPHVQVQAVLALTNLAGGVAWCLEGGFAIVIRLIHTVVCRKFHRSLPAQVADGLLPYKRNALEGNDIVRFLADECTVDTFDSQRLVIVASFIGCDALRYVLLDVVVEESVVVVVETCRSEKPGKGVEGTVGLGHHHTTVYVHLCISLDVLELMLEGFQVQHVRPQVFACRGVCVVEFPVQRIDADGTWHPHHVLGIGVRRAFSVPADDYTCVALAGSELQVRIGCKVFLGDGIAYNVGGHHAAVIVRVLLEIVHQHELRHGRALTVARNDERAAAVIVGKVVVECCCDVGVGRACKRRQHVAALLPAFFLILQAALAIVGDEHVGGGCIH